MYFSATALCKHFGSSAVCSDGAAKKQSLNKILLSCYINFLAAIEEFARKFHQYSRLS